MNVNKILRLSARRAQAAETYGKILGEMKERVGNLVPGTIARMRCAYRWESRWMKALEQELRNV